MSMKKIYSSPEILEVITIDAPVALLSASRPVDEDSEVETMGQEIGGEVNETDWTQNW